MTKSTKSQLIELIKESGAIGPAKIAQRLQISTQMVHRHLKTLLSAGTVEKIGAPPKVLYRVPIQQAAVDFPKLDTQQENYINEHYLAIKPDGQILEGLTGFKWWAKKTKQHKQFPALVREYISNHNKYSQQNRNQLGLIDATKKLEETFSECFLDIVFYQSFYSLPKFGKTKTGQMVMLGKSGQDLERIKALAELCRQSIINIIENFGIDGVIFTPHSIPRKISFLKEFKRYLNLPYPSAGLDKIFSGKVPIAQKSLSKLADRIENANNTFFLRDEDYRFKRVLVIDDAVGSGATLNAIAMKLKEQANAEFICGFAITGSMKDFDVISEI